MGWDASRPVPWRRLAKEWLVYAAIFAVVVAVFFRDQGSVLGILAGLALSLPLYLGLGYVLAKFGYQRQRLGDLRSRQAASDPAPDTADAGRGRPAPTKRTSSGPNRPGKGRRR